MMTKPTAEQVTFKSQGLGAVTRTLQDTTSEIISVKDFGAVGDGVADDTAAIQAAIDWAVYRNLPSATPVTWGIPTVFIPAGRYKVSDTIQLTYGDTYRSVNIRGDGKRFAGEARFCGTVLIPTFNDRPVIAVNSCLWASIQDLTMLGANRQYVLDNSLGRFNPLLDDLDENVWVNPAFPASASSQYAPFAAIAIDPYCGPRPAVSYPDINYPSWLNYTTQYGKTAASSDILIRNVAMEGFVVGVVVQPCDFDANGDFVKVENCVIGACQYGISVGNTQARDFALTNANMGRCYCCITTGKHGRKNGKPGFDVQNSSFNFSIWGAIIPNMQFGSNVAFTNVYAENMWGIGLFSATTSGAREGSVLFSECEFGFHSWIDRGIPRSPLVAQCPVTMTGCSLGSFGIGGGTAVPNIIHLACRADQLSIKNLLLVSGEAPTYIYEKQAINATTGLVIGNAETNLIDWSVRGTFNWNANTGAAIPQSGNVNHQRKVKFTRATGIPVYATDIQTNDWDYGIPFPRVESVSAKQTATSVSQSGKTVTVDFAGSRTALALASVGGDVGDVVVDATTGTVFIVSARTGQVVDMVAQNNLDENDELAVTISLSSGTFHFLNCRVYTLQQVHYGDISSSSATISNVVRADGNSANVNNADNGVQANDYAICGTGTAIGVTSPTNSLISSVTSNSIVLSGNARYTATRERLTYFVRQATANNT